MKGAFQISREIFENQIWQDIPKFRIFFYILGNAVFSHEGVKKGNILIKRGQYLRSFRNLANDLEYVENRAIKKYSTSVIKRKVDQLVKEERLKIEDTELGTLFTVVNYDKYQDLSNYKNDNLEQRWNSDGTAMEQRWNNNKNVNNVKNVSSSNNSDADFAEIMKFYRENLQKGISESLYNYELIQQWFDEWGKDLLLAAMKLSAQREAKGTAFIEGVLKNWKDAGVNNLEQARQYQLQFKQSSNKSFHNVTPFKPKEEDDDGYNYGF